MNAAIEVIREIVSRRPGDPLPASMATEAFYEEESSSEEDSSSSEEDAAQGVAEVDPLFEKIKEQCKNRSDCELNDELRKEIGSKWLKLLIYYYLIITIVTGQNTKRLIE